MDSEVRSFEIASEEDELLKSNREIWKTLGIKQGNTALFFPAPNALIPIMFAKYMNKRKVTFVDTNEIGVSTLIKLAAQMKLSNVTVKLASIQGKFPVMDNAFDISFSDWGFSYFVSQTNRPNEAEIIAKEFTRVTKVGGKIAAIEENGAPVMYPCPPEILSIRSKIESPRLDRLIMGRRVYGLFKANNLKNIVLRAYSNFLTGDQAEKMKAELTRRIAALDSQGESASGVSQQELERYATWLRSQIGNRSFLIQFNSILTVAEK